MPRNSKSSGTVTAKLMDTTKDMYVTVTLTERPLPLERLDVSVTLLSL